jgi:hypothetical protein
MDTLGMMMAWEEGELSGSNTVTLFQELVNTGQAWSLQGVYGRQAMALIEAGLISLPAKSDGSDSEEGE